MLLIDGVRYEEWIPEKEVEEFQPIVKEHVQDIFGNKSKYIEARRLKSKAGIGSVPDGFVIIFGDPPQWHIVEVELSAHQLYDHIVNQVGRFVNGIKNPVTQKNIIETIYQEIMGSKISKVEVEEAIGSGEIHKFLTDLISLSPILTIIIEKKTQELEEAINLLKYSPIKIVEFKTLAREGVGLAVHAHVFEPVSVGLPKVKSPVAEPPGISSRNQLYQQFFGELIDEYCKQYPSQSRLKALPQSWLGFGAGKSGLAFNWAFRANSKFSVELYIDTGDKAKNKEYFDNIKEQEAQLGITNISWERLDEKRASRVAIYTNGDIEEVMDIKIEKERLIQWAIEAMKNFSDKLKGIVKELQ